MIDLTQLITASMPVYPGTEPPHLTVASTYETDGFRETLALLLFPIQALTWMLPFISLEIEQS